MSLQKEVVIDRIEILEDGQMQIRQATRILEDGKLLSSAFHRSVVAPDKEDMTDQNDRVQAVASVLWTKEVKDKYKADKASKDPKVA